MFSPVPILVISVGTIGQCVLFRTLTHVNLFDSTGVHYYDFIVFMDLGFRKP